MQASRLPVPDDSPVHGRSVSYLEAGEGLARAARPRHGRHGPDWDPVIGPLALHNTVVAPDFPGHGESEPGGGDYSLGSLASGLRDLMFSLGHERATLVGHSLGGGVALQFTYQFRRWSNVWCWSPAAASGPRSAGPARRRPARRRPLHRRNRRPRPRRPALGRGSARSGCAQRRLGRGRPGLRLARRHRPPQGLPLDPSRGGRHRRPAGRRRSIASTSPSPADPDHLGRARPDHPRRHGRSRPRPAARQPARGLRRVGHMPQIESPAASPPSSSASSTTPSRPSSTAPNGAPASRPRSPDFSTPAPDRIRTCGPLLRRERRSIQLSYGRSSRQLSE